MLKVEKNKKEQINKNITKTKTTKKNYKLVEIENKDIKQTKTKKRFNIFKFTFGLIKTITILFFAIFALIICLQRFSNNTISIFNYRLFSVITGSMAPMYNIGDVILCKEVDIESIKVGDDITYLGSAGTYKNKIITHRVIEIKKDNSNELLFYTKGIASTRADPVVKSEQIYGKIIKRLDFLSWLYKYITTPNGFYVCIFIPLVILVGSEFVTMMVERYEEKKLRG